MKNQAAKYENKGSGKIKQQKEQLEQQLKERQTEVKQLQKKLKKQRQNGIKYVIHGHIRWAG